MKLERLLAITMMLLNKRRMSAPELAQHFEVSLRTVYRDLEAINAAGIPMVAYPGSNGGFEIMESYTIDRQYLSIDELVAVVAALKGVHTSTEDRQIGHLLEKVKALVIGAGPNAARNNAHPVVYDFNPWGSTQATRQKISQLRKAIEQRNRISIDYSTMSGDSQKRTMEPITLIAKGYVWYVYGFCLLRNDYRLFRLSRIAKLSSLPDTFQRHDVSVDKLEWSDEWENSERIALVLRFSPRVRVRVLDMFDPDEIEMQTDGSLLIRTMAQEDEWLHGMLLSYGDALCVLEPQSVRRRMRETVKKMLAVYEEC